MGKNNPLKVRIFIKDTETGITHPWESLTEEEISKYRARMTENMSNGMSDFYTGHPELFERL